MDLFELTSAMQRRRVRSCTAVLGVFGSIFLTSATGYRAGILVQVSSTSAGLALGIDSFALTVS